MPSKIFESLAMARPVILGVEGFAAEFLKRSGGGICIEPENADALLDAVERLRMDPRLGQAMAETGRNYVLKFFDRDKLAGDYLQLLERVLQGGLHSALAGSGAQTGQSTTVRTLN
jgi:glycosyltransferase involved in cell wall biosynthesis